VGNGAEINKGYRQEEPTEVVAPETPLCRGLPQAFPVCKRNRCTSPSIDLIQLSPFFPFEPSFSSGRLCGQAKQAPAGMI